MKVTDITKDWVVKNFDLDEHRKMKKYRIEVGCIEAFNPYTKTEYSVYLSNIQKEIKANIRTMAKRHSVTVNQCVGTINVESSWDDYSDLNLTVEFEKEETDDQVISRLRSREKQKIKKQTTKASRDATDLKNHKKLKDEIAKLEKKMGMRS